MRFKLYIEYDGTRYSGWQVQLNTPHTIQGIIQKALSDVLKTQDFELYGAGRTDAGVHALEQVAHLETGAAVSPENLKNKINHLLPKDIVIIHAETAPKDFHARGDAVARSYLYQVCSRPSAFGRKFVYMFKAPLDIKQVNHAAELFLGFNNFFSFTADDPEEKSTKVLLESIQTREIGSLFLIRITGSHFLWRMVRQMVGILLEAGRGRISMKEIEEMLKIPSSLPAKSAVPPSGLFLEKVYYPGEPRRKEITPPILIT